MNNCTCLNCDLDKIQNSDSDFKQPEWFKNNNSLSIIFQLISGTHPITNLLMLTLTGLIFFNHLYVLQSHPSLRFCPGPNCSVIVKAKESKAKKVFCPTCKTCFW